MTPPTLSRIGQIIEDHVGSKVLERSSSGVRPTKIGENLVKIGRKIQENRLAAEDAVNLWKERLEREVRIGVGPMLAISVMGSFFTELMLSPPKFAVRVVSATASRLVERLNQNELDIVVAPEQINLLQDELEQTRIFEDKLAIFVGRDHPLAQIPGPLDSDALENQKWLSVGTLSGIYGSNADVLKLLGINHISSTLSFTGDINMSIELLRNSRNLCILPRKLGLLSVADQSIVPLNIAEPLPNRHISIWQRKQDRNKPEIDFLKSRMGHFFLIWNHRFNMSHRHRLRDRMC